MHLQVRGLDWGAAKIGPGRKEAVAVGIAQHHQCRACGVWSHVCSEQPGSTEATALSGPVSLETGPLPQNNQLPGFWDPCVLGR